MIRINADSRTTQDELMTIWQAADAGLVREDPGAMAA